MKFILDHPALLALALPFVLGSIPTMIGFAEKRFLAKLLAAGDASDQKAIRATVKAWVLWAEEKHLLPGMGEVKYQRVDALLGRALPMLSADQRQKLIESVLKEIDDDAHKIVGADPQPEP